MEDPKEVISIEEMWIKLQIFNIRSIKLYKNIQPNPENSYGDKNPLIWENLLTRQHDGFNVQTGKNFPVWTLDINKVSAFNPLKLKDCDEKFPWYYLKVDHSAIRNYPTGPLSMMRSCFTIELRYKDKCLLFNQFNDIKELSGDNLLNW